MFEDILIIKENISFFSIFLLGQIVPMCLGVWVTLAQDDFNCLRTFNSWLMSTDGQDSLEHQILYENYILYYTILMYYNICLINYPAEENFI